MEFLMICFVKIVVFQISTSVNSSKEGTEVRKQLTEEEKTTFKVNSDTCCSFDCYDYP